VTVEVNEGIAWIIGLLAAIPILRQAWLFGREIKGDIRGAERNPPLAEEAAKTYVTKPDFMECQKNCKLTTDSIRVEMKENDRKAEERVVGTHRRMDKLSNAVSKLSRGMGILIGLQIAQAGGDPKQVKRIIEDTDNDNDI